MTIITRRQEKLAVEIIKDVGTRKPRTKKELLASAGYEIGTGEGSPGRTLAQKGVKEALRIRGFSEQQADKVVSEIMHSKRVNPHTRLDAADKIYKRLGSYAPEKRISLVGKIPISPEKKAEVKKALSEYFNAKTKKDA